MTGNTGECIAAPWELLVEFSHEGEDTVVEYMFQMERTLSWVWSKYVTENVPFLFSLYVL